MIERPIRVFNSNKQVPPRFCDVLIDEENNVFLESKMGGNKIKIPYYDLVYQVESAIEENK